MITLSLIKYKLMKKIVGEFTERGIFEEHRKYIKAWFTYLDQKEFGERLEKQLINEIKRYLSTRDSNILDYMVKIIWNETDTEAWIVVVQKSNNRI